MIIKVKADATKTVAPDYMGIKIYLTSLNKEKDDSIQKVLENFKEVEKFLKDNGVEEKLKTTEYRIEESYENQRYEEKDGKNIISKYRRVFKGFVVAQALTFEHPLDVLLATKLVTMMSKKDEIHVNVDYFLKDRKAFQDEVIKEALERARQKAGLIAKTFNDNAITCKLIDYTLNDFNHHSTYKMVMEDSVQINAAKRASVEDIAETLEPKEITLREDIYSEWEVDV